VLTGLELISSSIFSLFSEMPAGQVSENLFAIEQDINVLRKNFLLLSNEYDCAQLFVLLETINPDQIRKLGPEYFYPIIKKISKKQSIENFARFVVEMFKVFNNDMNFVKNFFYNERDGQEVQHLLHYLEQSKLPEQDKKFLISKAVLISLEKLVMQSKFQDFFLVLEGFYAEVSACAAVDYQKSLQKILISFVQLSLFKPDGKSLVRQCFEKFITLKFEFNHFLFNKILDIINNKSSNEELIFFVFETMGLCNIRPNIITYNTVMDYYCAAGDFEKAYALTKVIQEQGLQLDSFSLSILIKGIKNCRSMDIAVIAPFLEFFHETKIEKDIIMFNSLIDILISMNENQRAHEVYRDLIDEPSIQPDQITFNTLIKGCCKVRNFDQALTYFKEMRQHDIKPNRITFNSIMDLAVKIQDLSSCLYFVDEMNNDEISPDGYTYSIILNGLKQNNSPPELVNECLENIKKVIDLGEFKLDDVFFNSILDICSKYDLYDQMKEFYALMNQKNIPENSTTFGIIVKAFGKMGEFELALKTFEKMIETHITINDVTYGCILDACAKAGRIEIAHRIFNSLRHTKLNQNSIVFTTIIKGYIKANNLDAALEFFNNIKAQKHLTGMIITYNCGLDVLVRKEAIADALKLFEEIDSLFGADLISYSTVIKGLCIANTKMKALDFVKKMVQKVQHIDISVVNLFLDSCANPTDFRLGIQGYQYVLENNLRPNEITFGIMIKTYGFSRELEKAFDLIELMRVYEIKRSIIIYTNLIHISFYSKNCRKAELAFTLMKKEGLVGDKLLYSKLIDGLIRFGETTRLEKYLDHSIADDCGIKAETIERIRESDEFQERFGNKLFQIETILKQENFKKKAPLFDKPKYNINNENPKMFKKMIHEQNKLDLMNEQKKDRNHKKPDGNFSKENPSGKKQFQQPLKNTSKEPNREVKMIEQKTDNFKDKTKPLTLFNFRDKKAKA